MQFSESPDASTDPRRRRNDGAQRLAAEMTAAHTSCAELRVGQVIFRLMENRLAEFGLDARQYSVLSVLLTAGASSQEDLGVFLRINAESALSIINDLAVRGLVSPTHGLRGGRDTDVSLTDAGQVLLGDIDEVTTEFDRQMILALRSSPGRRPRASWVARLRSIGVRVSRAIQHAR